MTVHRSIARPLIAALTLSAGGCVLAALAIPGSAPAAAATTIRLSQGCYQTAQQAGLTGAGFDPSSHWSAKLDGSAFGKGKTNAKGDITATFGVPSRLRAGSTGEDSYRLVVREGKHSASATFVVTRLTAGFAPSSGDVAKLKVRFRMLGWGRKGSLYLHYLNPKGTPRLDRYLGPAGGACGHLLTSPQKLFPFRPKVGVWTFQFDKSSAYKSTSVPRVVIRYKVS